MKNILIAIPCFNEESEISNFINTINKFYQKFKLNNIYNYKVVFFNDGSTDQTLKILEDNKFQVFTNKINKGLAYTFNNICNYASLKQYDGFVIIDADNQFDFFEIDKMLTYALKNNFDFVSGNRFHSENTLTSMSFTKKIGNFFLSKIMSLISGKNIKDGACGFRYYSNNVITSIRVTNPFTYSVETILHAFSLPHINAGFLNIKVIYYKHRDSKVFKGPFNYFKRIISTLYYGCVYFFPLRCLGFVSLIFYFIGILLIFNFFITSSSSGGYKGNLYLAFMGSFLFLLGSLMSVLAILCDFLKKNNHINFLKNVK